MLKLPSILIGLILLVGGIVTKSAWLYVPGLLLLVLGFFVLGWDFDFGSGQAAPAERIDPKIPPSDVEAIRSIIHDLPDVDKRIISMHLDTDGTVRVMTGIVGGPRLGSGRSVTLAREAERWHVTSVERWVS